MKIVHVVYSLEVGGAEVLVAELCRRQRANGHEVSICAYSRLGTIGETLRAEGFAIYVPGEAHPGVTMLRYLQHFGRVRPDVVHCHNPAPTIQAALPARLAGARCVVATRHSLVAPPYDVAEERRFNLMARSCDWVVGICEVTAKNLRGTPLADREKIVRVYNGASAVERTGADSLGIEGGLGKQYGDSGCARMTTVEGQDLQLRGPRPDLKKRGFSLLFVGRLAGVKDLGTLIRAVALARRQNPSVTLWIVGDGPVRGELEALAAELGLGDGVVFWGQRMDAGQFFNAADAFAMSSVSEGLPMSLLQAMSAGLPAVLTDVGGMAEVMGIARSGLLVPVGDVAAYAEAILRLAGDAELRAEFGRRAVKAYWEKFTLERMDAGYMEVYGRER